MTSLITFQAAIICLTVCAGQGAVIQHSPERSPHEVKHLDRPEGIPVPDSKSGPGNIQPESKPSLNPVRCPD
jgi:hypothetical protein